LRSPEFQHTERGFLYGEGAGFDRPRATRFPPLPVAMPVRAASPPPGSHSSFANAVNAISPRLWRSGMAENSNTLSPFPFLEIRFFLGSCYHPCVVGRSPDCCSRRLPAIAVGSVNAPRACPAPSPASCDKEHVAACIRRLSISWQWRCSVTRTDAGHVFRHGHRTGTAPAAPAGPFEPPAAPGSYHAGDKGQGSPTIARKALALSGS